ncbi:hypothetical protein pb186bvf_010002 [Paramecium bursaria]
MNKIELASKKKKCQLESVSGSNYQLQPLDSPKDEKNELQQFNLTNQIHTTQVMPLSGGSPRKPRPETKQKINTNISKETFINISLSIWPSIQFGITLHFLSRLGLNTLINYGLVWSAINQILHSISQGTLTQNQNILGINQAMNQEITISLQQRKNDMPPKLLNQALYLHILYYIPLSLLIIFNTKVYNLFIDIQDIQVDNYYNQG